MHEGPGLTVTRFFDALPESALRRFVEPEILSVLDAMFGGRVDVGKLRRIAVTLVDFDDLLQRPAGRRLVLSELTERKRAELALRLQCDALPSTSDGWRESEIRELRDFFGLLEEQTARPQVAAAETVAPQYGLFDHQRDAVRHLRPLLSEDDRRAVLHFPTGVGKTRTAMHIVAATLREHEPCVVVWLASGRELLEQARAAFSLAWTHLGNRTVSLGAMWADHMPDLDAFADGFLVIGLAKGWSVISLQDEDWAVRLSPKVRLVVFDEAHQSIARTYRRVTDELTLDGQCSLLGLTATPGRTWADIDKDGELAKFYAHTKVALELPGDNPIRHLIEHGYLSRPIFRTMLCEPGTRISDADVSRIAVALDTPSEVVERLSMTDQYVTAVMRAILTLLTRGHRRVLVFAASVAHARLLAALLLVKEVRAAAVTAETPTRIRDREIHRFVRDGLPASVLVNFGVLTTGFDAPLTSAVVIARPTRSLVLYSQMIGRAIRGPKAGGTETCEIVTVLPDLPGFRDVAEAFLNWEDAWT